MNPVTPNLFPGHFRTYSLAMLLFVYLHESRGPDSYFILFHKPIR